MALWLPSHCWVLSTHVFPHPCLQLHVQCIWQKGRKAYVLFSCAALSMISHKERKKQMLFPATALRFSTVIIMNRAWSSYGLSCSARSTRISHFRVSNKCHSLLPGCETLLLLCPWQKTKLSHLLLEEHDIPLTCLEQVVTGMSALDLYFNYLKVNFH